MAMTTGGTFEAWREALGEWRQTGDISSLAEVAAAAPARLRSGLVDSIVPSGLRHEIIYLCGRLGRGARQPG